MIIARNPPRLSRVDVRRCSRSPLAPAGESGGGEGSSARIESAPANISTGGRCTHRCDALQTVPPTRDCTLATKERHAKTRSAHADRRVRRCGLHPSSLHRFHAGDILPTDVDEASCFVIRRATGGRSKDASPTGLSGGLSARKADRRKLGLTGRPAREPAHDSAARRRIY